MVDLISGLKPLGVKAMVIFPEKGDLSLRLEELGIPSAQLPFANCVQWRSAFPKWHPRRLVSIAANSVRSTYKRFANPAQTAQLSEVCQEFKADAIVTNTVAINTGLSVSKRLGLPHVWHIREFGDKDWDFYPDFGLGARRRQMQESALLVFVSNAVKKHHLQQCRLSDSGKYKVIYNAIATRAEIERRLSIDYANHSRHGVVFGFSGYVKYSKGQFDAVHAFKLACEQGLRGKLVFAGEGANRELQSLVDELGMRHLVEIRGHLPQREMEGFYRSIDCGLMCSVSEGFGRTTAEYMSWGKPVLGRDGGATPEIVRDGLNGYLYDGSIESLAKTMSRIASCEVTRLQLGSAAGRFALENFVSEKASSEFLSALKAQDLPTAHPG